jgi:hypothetical protein
MKKLCWPASTGKIFGSGNGNLTTDSVDLGRLPRKNELVSLLNRLLKNFEGHFKIEGELNKFYKSSGTCPNLGLFNHPVGKSHLMRCSIYVFHSFTKYCSRKSLPFIAIFL